MSIRYRSGLWSIGLIALLMSSSPGAAQQQEKTTNPRTSSSGGESPTVAPPSAAAGAKPVPSVAASSDSDAKERGAQIPAWTLDARWYYVAIPRFCNGDPQNDPTEAVPWSADWPTIAKDVTPETADLVKLEREMKDRRYGGDLKGLIKQLPYLKELGVNALCLSPVFHGAGELQLGQVDLRHVDPWLGVKSSLDESSGESSDPGTWKWTSSDKLLLDLIRRAHEQNTRVVISGLFRAVMSAEAQLSDFEAYYMAATKRWMDPDGDGNPSDGVDGWFLSLEEGPLKPFEAREAAFWDRWREAVRRLNPNAVVIGSGPLAAAARRGGPFDIVIDEPLVGAIQYFFYPANKSATVKELFDVIDNPRSLSTRTSNLTLVSSAGRAPRLLSALAEQDQSAVRGRVSAPSPMPDDGSRARWRLATIFQHFCPGAPATYYGDEVGMYGGSGAFASAAMWWKDGSDHTVRSPHYRDDFFALVQWLHRMREWYEPLRRGEFRRVLADDVNKTLAFARTLPGNEIILVMNYGDKKQKIELPAGKPGQLVAVFSPQVQPAERGTLPTRKTDGKAPDAKTDKVEALGVGGSRQFVNPEGKVRIWVAAMSVRVVFVNDKEPRR